MHLPPLGLDALLLFFQHLLVHRIAVKEVQELLLLLLKRLKPTSMASRLLLGVLKNSPGVLLNSPTNRLLLVRRQPDTGVKPLNCPFNIPDLEIAAPTAAPRALMTEAAEIVIETAPPPYAVEDHPTSAKPTEQGATEVVLVLSRTVAAQASCVQDLLHLLKGRHIDEARMSPVGVLRATPFDDADVVVIPQHPMHLATRQRQRAARWGFALPQACFLKDGMQFRD